jgi:hypothetical protein
MKKVDLDREVAREMGVAERTISQVTYLFLQKIMKALAQEDIVQLSGFGTFKVGPWHGGDVRHLQGKCPDGKHNPGFRVHFSKSRTVFNKKILQARQEKTHGEVRRRRISGPRDS